MYTLQLFAKHPETNTRVYDTMNAPHLIMGSRYEEQRFFGGGKP
jgi:hypothetical protein